MKTGASFVGPCLHRDRDYCIGSNFAKFYLIRIGFTLDEPLSFTKVFRLFRLEPIFFWCLKCGHSRQMYKHLIYWQGQHVCDAFVKQNIQQSGKRRTKRERTQVQPRSTKTQSRSQRGKGTNYVLEPSPVARSIRKPEKSVNLEDQFKYQVWVELL